MSSRKATERGAHWAPQGPPEPPPACLGQQPVSEASAAGALAVMMPQQVGKGGGVSAHLPAVSFSLDAAPQNLLCGS